MDDHTKNAAIAESRVVTELLKNGFSVFTQLSGKEPFDIAIYKNGTFLRVQVKGTKVRSKNGDSFVVQMKSVRHNRTQNTIKRFDSELCDLLAVYVFETDTVCFIPAKEVNGMCALQIRDGEAKGKLKYGTKTHNTMVGL
jgi:hypothetical protein